MAYPTISAPYGLKPVNLVGGQQFSGSTRSLPIAYNYGTALYYGDLVTLGTAGSNAGYVVAAPTSTSLVAKSTIGVFLGCYYTNPTTKQRLYSQYYPGSITAGDITAIVCDDPDTVFKVAVVASASSNTISSIPTAMIGLNAVVNTPVGSASTGDSGLGIVATTTTTAVASGGALRVMGLVPDTQISNSCLFSSTTASTVVVTGLPVGLVVPIGTDIFQLVNGQLQQLGVSACTTAATTVTTTGSTTLTIGAAITTTPSVGATVVLVQSQEALVKFNFGVHNYYAA
jgi:hypothetical protein